jgi:hypothetical protein
MVGLFPFFFPQIDQITISSPRPGEELRSKVVIVRGVTQSKQVTIDSGIGPSVSLNPIEGTFSIPVELKEGRNVISVRAASGRKETVAFYKPIKSAYRIRVVYIQAADEPNPSMMEVPKSNKRDVSVRYSTALKLMQGFCEDYFRTSGFGSKSFQLNFDRRGEVEIEWFKSKLSGVELRKRTGNELWSYFYRELVPQVKVNQERVLAIMGFSRYDAATQKVTGHTALGGGFFALFGSGSIRYWPNSVSDSWRAFHDPKVVDPKVSFDDSGLRYTAWANASTTIGAMMHELGHTFGLPHTTDNRCIMSRGFDAFNGALFGTEIDRSGTIRRKVGSYWDPVFGERLNLNPFFQPDRTEAKEGPMPVFTRTGNCIQIECQDPIRLVSLWQEGKKMFLYKTNSKKLEYGLDELKAKIDSAKVAVVVTTESGVERTENF